jgi:hypothetical protein
MTIEPSPGTGTKIVVAECCPDPQSRREVMDFIRAATGGWGDFKPCVRDGSYARYLAAGTTERKSPEEALRENEQELPQLAGLIREVLWHTGPQGPALALGESA